MEKIKNIQEIKTVFLSEIIPPNANINLLDIPLKYLLKDIAIPEKIQLTALLITPYDQTANFTKEIQLKWYLTRESHEKNEILEKGDFNSGKKHIDPYFAFYAVTFAIPLNYFSFVENNINLTIDLTTADFRKDNYYFKEIVINGIYSDNFENQEVLPVQPKINFIPFKSKLQFPANLIRIIQEFLPFEEVQQLRLLNKHFYSTIGKLKKTVIFSDQNKSFSASGHNFMWCSAIYKEFIIEEEILNVGLITIKIICFDQGWGNAEKLAWCELILVDFNNINLIKPIKVCDAERNSHDNESTVILRKENKTYDGLFKKMEKGNKIIVLARCATPGWSISIKKLKINILSMDTS